jgi:hypothetical protein
MYCGNCGKKLVSEEKYCTTCGHAALINQLAQPATQRDAEFNSLDIGRSEILLKNKKLHWILFGIIVFVCGIFLFSKMFYALSEPKKFESYTAGFYVGSYAGTYAGYLGNTDDVRFAQPFITTAAHTVTSIKVAVARNGYPVGGPGGYDFILKLYAADLNHKPSGAVLASGAFASINTPTYATSDGMFNEFVLDNEVSLASNTEYVFVISAPHASAPSNYGSVFTSDAGEPSAPNGWITSNGGNTWTPSVTGSALFEAWGKCTLSIANYKCIFLK